MVVRRIHLAQGVRGTHRLAHRLRSRGTRPFQIPTREQRIERAFNTWVAEHSSSINPEQAKMLALLRNVVLAAGKETKYEVLDPTIFTRPPFTFLGGRTRIEGLFGRERLSSIMEELRQLIASA